MKRKPTGAKYRNLTVRKGVIYYQRVVGARRVRFSCNPQTARRPEAQEITGTYASADAGGCNGPH